MMNSNASYDQFQTLIKGVDSFSDFLVNHLSENKCEVEEVAIREALDLLVAIQMQLLDYVKESTEDATLQLISKIAFENTSSSSSASSSETQLFDYSAFSSNVSTSLPQSVIDSGDPEVSSSQVESDLQFFAPRIVVMEVLRVETRANNSYLLMRDDPNITIGSCVKVQNLTNPSSYVQSKILVLTNADARVLLPLLIICDPLIALVTVAPDVALGRVACPLGFTCHGNESQLISRDIWATYCFNTTRMLKVGHKEIVLMQHTILPPNTKSDPIVEVSPAWGYCVVDVDWDVLGHSPQQQQQQPHQQQQQQLAS
eukprot:TRINITY_DN5326_c0_g1_i2.p1 TRINITY_DN5326_c0_g1~~TRINITY_DN5326_c0_g1_i2.p1  ORF type:complete len:314 (-),score=56.94 TRINITY_DN5326_c0_g1_i2:76-1017(-)